jgi:hypothetical protein
MTRRTPFFALGDPLKILSIFVIFYCNQDFFWYNAKLKIITQGGYGHRLENKVVALLDGSA